MNNSKSYVTYQFIPNSALVEDAASGKAACTIQFNRPRLPFAAIASASNGTGYENPSGTGTGVRESVDLINSDSIGTGVGFTAPYNPIVNAMIAVATGGGGGGILHNDFDRKAFVSDVYLVFDLVYASLAGEDITLFVFEIDQEGGLNGK